MEKITRDIFGQNIGDAYFPFFIMDHFTTILKYSPIRNCREYSLICFGGLEVVIFAYSKFHAYWVSGSGGTHIRLKNGGGQEQTHKKLEYSLISSPARSQVIFA